MRKPIKTLLWVFLVSTLIFSAHAAINTKMLCPKTNKDPYERNIHNDTVTDNYHWLRDASWPSIKNDKIIKHLKKENQYTKNYFFKIFRDRIYPRAGGLIAHHTTNHYHICSKVIVIP